MKQHNKYNDEELYQQIMAELKPSADEYDRLMAEGKNPAGKSKVAIPIYKYVAAACIGFAIIGTSIYTSVNGEKNRQQPVAEIAVPIVINEKDMPGNTLADTDAESLTIADNSIAKTSRRKPKHASTVHTTEPISNDDTGTDECEQDFLYALITEVENNVLTEQREEEQLYHSIIDEVTANIYNESKKPELNL